MLWDEAIDDELPNFLHRPDLSNQLRHELFTQITVAAGNIYRAIFGDSYPEYTYGLVKETGELHRLSKFIPRFKAFKDDFYMDVEEPFKRGKSNIEESSDETPNDKFSSEEVEEQEKEDDVTV